MNAEAKSKPNRARRVLRTAAERSALIEQYKSSGLSKTAFCRDKSVHPVTLSQWMKNREPARGFAQVELPPRASAPIEIALSNGVCVRLRPFGKPGDLAELVRRIAGC